ncbi:MAG TPA: dTMP kinase [Candidatus Gastranaerophilales bacterium]|nr:dTMP kinase [Candidatus Gastranaerophilales bacterium]
MSKKALFITFEGIDGCGKSTQLDLAAKYLETKGIDLIKTRDPGGTPLGCKIREILLNYDGNVASYCELFLYLADRAQHVEEKILPALKLKKLVLCDRYVDSTMAYQGYARGLGAEQILNLNNIVAKSLMPDLTFVFDVSLETSRQRVGDKKDRLESEADEFHKKVREGYLDLAEKFPERIVIIDANKDISEVEKNVIEVLNKRVL